MDYSEATFWYLIWRDSWPLALLIALFVLVFALGTIDRIGSAIMRRVRASRRRAPRGNLMGRPFYVHGDMPSSRAEQDGER